MLDQRIQRRDERVESFFPFEVQLRDQWLRNRRRPPVAQLHRVLPGDHDMIGPARGVLTRPPSRKSSLQNGRTW